MISEGSPVVHSHEENPKEGKAYAGPGHNAIIQDDAGTYWMVYHAMDKANAVLPNGTNNRVLMIDPLIWKDGWPEVKDNVPGNLPQKAPVIK